MLVLSRQAGSSVVVESVDESCIITVLKLIPELRAVSVLVSQSSAGRPGKINSASFELKADEVTKLGDAGELTIVDVRHDGVRLGFNGSRETSIHRLEVHNALERERQNALRFKPQDDAEDGMAGSRVPRSPTPRPPTLDVRLQEPRDPELDDQSAGKVEGQ